MIITRVSTSPGSDTQDMGRRQVLTPVGASPQVFRQAFYLRIVTGGMAERLVFDAANCRLRAKFLPYDYDAINTDKESLKAKVSQLDDGVLVELDTPRHVVGVHVASNKMPGSGWVLEYYRADGNNRSQSPFATSNPPLRIQDADGVRGEMIAVGDRIATVSHPAESIRRAMGIEHSESMYPGTSPEYQVGPSQSAQTFFADFTEVRFIVRLHGPRGSYVYLTPQDVVRVDVRSYPSGPRVGLAFPESPALPVDPSSAVFFRHSAGEIGKTAQTADGSVDAGHGLAMELQRASDRLADSLSERPSNAPMSDVPAVLPDTLDAALVVESDAPCVLVTDELQVHYYMTRQAFPEGEDKHVLRFGADRVVSREFSLSVPSNSDIVSATLDTNESLQAGRAVPQDGGSDPLLSLSGSTGFRTDSRRWIARRIVLDEARVIVGIGVGVMALRIATRLKVEVQEDVRGLPSGRKLAEGVLQLDPSSKLQWSTIRVDKFLIAPEQPHWLLLTAIDGEAVWLSENGEGSVLALSRPNPDGLWQTEASFEDTSVRYVLFEYADPSQGQPVVSLRVGDTVVNGSRYDSDTGTRTYDLASALEAYLAAHPSADIAEIPLSLTSAVPGMVTAYPPLITYDLRA